MRPQLRLFCTLLMLIRLGLISPAELSAKEPATLSIDPYEVQLTGPNSRLRLLVRQSVGEGRQVDVTRTASYQSLTPEICTVDDKGVISAISNGRGELDITGEDAVLVSALLS